MRLSALKSLTTEECRRRLAAGQITRFQSMFRDYLNGEISWPQYCGPDVASLRERLNLTQEALAALLKVSPKTVFRWEAEAETIQPNYCIALCMLDKLGEGVFTRWMSTRSTSRSKPLQRDSPRLPEDETELTDFLSEKRRSSKTQSNTEEPQPVLRKFSNDPETIELSNQQLQSLLDEIALPPDDEVKARRRHLMSYELWK